MDDIRRECIRAYLSGGLGAVTDIINKKYSNHTTYKNCWQCEVDTPHIDNECLVCGTFTRS